MFCIQYAFIVFIALLGLPVRAQVVQDDWISPPLPDLETKILIGNKFTISWTRNLYAWFPQYAPNANPGNVDLWIKSTKSDDQILIQTGVNVNITQSIQWQVEIPDRMLTASTFWSFQFRPAGAKTATEEISSPQVVVRKAAVDPVPDTTKDSNPTATSDDGSNDSDPTGTSGVGSNNGSNNSGATPTLSPLSSESSAESTSSPSLSGGAIAGIVIGALAVLIMAAGLFIWWKRNRAPTTPNMMQVHQDAPQYSQVAPQYYAESLAGTGHSPYQHNIPVEISANDKPPIELAATEIR